MEVGGEGSWWTCMEIVYVMEGQVLVVVVSFALLKIRAVAKFNRIQLVIDKAKGMINRSIAYS